MLGDAIDCFCKIYRKASARDIDTATETKKKTRNAKVKGEPKSEVCLQKASKDRTFFYNIKHNLF